MIVEMYQMLSANSEICSDRKHHQHEAGLFSKGRSIVNGRKYNLAGNKQSKRRHDEPNRSRRGQEVSYMYS